ncbi:NUT family member 2D-like [Cynocephalus volans]|uniref:NUT family member 2D-like n=1 Tax=Cynocephalus volans TaxID=110931 RepID=UPI002FC7077E
MSRRAHAAALTSAPGRTRAPGRPRPSEPTPALHGPHLPATEAAVRRPPSAPAGPARAGRRLPASAFSSWSSSPPPQPPPPASRPAHCRRRSRELPTASNCLTQRLPGADGRSAQARRDLAPLTRRGGGERRPTPGLGGQALLTRLVKVMKQLLEKACEKLGSEEPMAALSPGASRRGHPAGLAGWLCYLPPSRGDEGGKKRGSQEDERMGFGGELQADSSLGFMEFEAEEETQLQKLQCMKGPQGLPPPAPLKLGPPGPPAPNTVPQPVLPFPSVAGSGRCGPAMHLASLLPQQPPQAKAPKEILPEADQEYVDIMEALLGPDANQEESDLGQQQEEDGLYPDPGLLSYTDKLCSQEDFTTKVEATIHARFLADLLSPDPKLDPLSLTEELEQEEGLTLAQSVEKRLLALNDAGGVRPPQVMAHPDWTQVLRLRLSKQQKEMTMAQAGVSVESCPAQLASHDPPWYSRAHANLPRPKERNLWPGFQSSPMLRAARPSSPPQSHRLSSPGLRGSCPAMPEWGPAVGSSEEEEEDLPSLGFLLTCSTACCPGGCP